MKPFEPKARHCKQCGSLFAPVRPLQSVCSPKCAAKKVKADKAEERSKLKQRKEAIKTRQQWLAECQAIANRYARIRDAKDGCISCDKPASWDGQWHGSHFRSVGAASAIRLNLWNIHKACSVCNHHLSGNIAGYRPRLVEKIGQDKVDWLEAQNHLVRYDIEYLKKYKQVMGKRLKRLEKKQ